MIHNLFRGLTALGNGPAIGYLLVSSIVGMLTGILPGLGGPVLLSIVLAFIYHVSLTGALCIFLAIHAASFFTSSITAILLNTPSHAESFAVTFDGFPMAQRGEAGRALGISAASTCIGGLVGCAVLVAFIQLLNDIPRWFQPPQYVGLVLIALLLVGTLGTDAISKALISMGLGILISSIGQDPVTGVFRFTFGSLGLYGGVSLVALALGLFAIPQMLLLFGVAERVARQDMTGRDIGKIDPAEIGDHFGRQVIEGIAETFRHWFVTVRGGLVGVLTGFVPGIGAFAANFMSYGLAQQFSKKRDQFGTGIAEGIIAPESSSLAKEAGGLLPLLALGIPGGVGSALFLAALTIKNVHVGYNFTVTYPILAYEMVWIVAIGGVVGTLIGVIAAPWLARVTKIPGPCLVPVIMALCVLGAYVAATSFFVVMELLVFTALGFILRRLRYAIAVLVIALVLGPTLESNIYLTHEVYSGWAFMERPFSDVLAAIVLAILTLKITQQRRETRRARAALTGLQGEELTAAAELQERLRRPYPLLAMVTSLAVFGVALGATVFAMTHYSFITAIMPVFGGSIAALGAASRLPGDIAGYLRYRHHRPHVEPVDPAAPKRIVEPEPALVGAGGPALVEGPDEGLSAEDLELIEAMGPPPVSATWPTYPGIRDKAWGRAGQYSRELAGFGWFAALIAASYVFDFFVALPAFCVLYSVTSLHRTFPRLRSRLIFGVITAAATWGTAYEMFNVIHITFHPVVHF